MKKRQIAFGIGLVLLGLIALINALFDVDLWRFIGPLLLIGVGVILILRPRMAGSDAEVHISIFGDVTRSGGWEAQQHEFWWFIGSARLDFTKAVFNHQDTLVKVYGFIDDVTLILPESVGFRVESSAFVSEYHAHDGKIERILSPLSHQSADFEQAEKRVILHTLGFVSEVKIHQPLQ
jgi:hypothetical protein